MSDESLLGILVKLSGAREVQTELAALKGEITDMGKAGAVTSGRLKKLSFNAGLLGTAFGKIAHYGKLAGLGLIGAGVASVAAGANFQQHMAQVHSVTNANIKQMKLLSDTALHEATITRFSASEAADGMYRLGRAGFNANEVLAAIPGTLNLAHASGIDMATAAQIEAESLRSFGLQASQSGMVADVLAKATQGGAMSMQDLGDAVKYFGATAYGTGQKLPAMIGLLKMMALHSVRGSRAGTTLRQALSRLVNPQKQTAKGLELLNIQASDLYNSNGLKGLPVILKTMYQHLNELDKVSRKKAISQIFGQNALGGMMAIFNQGPKAMQRFIDQMNNSGGTAKHMADILNNTLQMRLLRLWHTLEVVGIRMSMPFNSWIEKRIGAVDDKLGKYADSFDALKKLSGSSGNAILWILDDIFHAHGKLIKVGHQLEAAFKIAWTFVKTVILPVALTWGRILLTFVVVAFVLLVRVMKFANSHARIAKIVVMALVGAYVAWKIITLTALVVQKAMVAWQIIQVFWWVLTKVSIVANKIVLIAYRLVLMAVRLAIIAFTAVMWLMNAAMDANPIALIIIALVLLGVGIYLIVKHWSYFHGKLIAVWNWIKNNWASILLWLTVPLLMAVLFIIRHWNDIINFFVNFPSIMKRLGGDLWAWLRKPFHEVMKWILGKLDDFIRKWHKLIGIIKDALGLGGTGPAGQGTIGYGGRYGAKRPPTSVLADPGAAYNTSIYGRQPAAPGFAMPGQVPVQAIVPVTVPSKYQNPLDDVMVHSVLNIDGKTLVEAYSKAKATTRSRRGG